MASIQEKMIDIYLQKLLGGKTPSEKRRDKLLLRDLERRNDLSDIALLDSISGKATTEAEINLANETYNTVESRNVSSDPLIQATIEASGHRINKNTELYENFKFAVNNAERFMIDGEFPDLDFENMTFPEIHKQTVAFRRIQHAINTGTERNFSYTPQGKKNNSDVIGRRLNDHVKQLDLSLNHLVKSGSGKNLPDDAIRALMVGDEALFEKIEQREIGMAQTNYTRHSGRWHTLNNYKMDADSRASSDDFDGNVSIMPATMVKDLNDSKDKEAAAEFVKLFQQDQQLQQAFTTGFNTNTRAVIDYNKYSTILEAQMELEERYIDDANKQHSQWTGSYIEKFRGAPDYSKIKTELSKTGLTSAVTGADSTLTGVGSTLTDKTKEKIVKEKKLFFGLPEGTSVGVFDINRLGDYNKIGIPRAGESVDDLQFFKDLEQKIIDMRLGTRVDGEARGKLKTLDRIKKTYDKKLAWKLRGVRDKGKRSTQHYFETKSKQAFMDFLQSKQGGKLLEKLEAILGTK